MWSAECGNGSRLSFFGYQGPAFVWRRSFAGDRRPAGDVRGLTEEEGGQCGVGERGVRRRKARIYAGGLTTPKPSLLARSHRAVVHDASLAGEACWPTYASILALPAVVKRPGPHFHLTCLRICLN